MPYLVLGSSRKVPSTRTLHDPELNALASDIPKIILRDRAPQTVKKYASAFHKWKSWAKSKGLQVLPATGYEFALYLASLIKNAKSMATIYAAVYGISWAHQKMAMVSPTEHPLIKQMIEASKRIIGTAPINRKQPLGVEHVKKLVNKFGVGDLSNLQITCLVALGFSGFLRWDDLSRLRKEDFSFQEECMRVFLHKRKNDQYREGSWILIARTSNLTCPVQLMEKFFRRGGHRPSDFVFRKISHTTTGMKLRKEQMTYSRARELFSKQLKGIGLDPSLYGLHSLRSGGTTEAAAWGISDRLIQRHGGWRSEVSMNMYIKETKNALLRVSKSLGL